MSLFEASLIPALDADGDPISGATWNFYSSGTNTPLSVYGDAELTVRLGDTVVANAAGRFAPIYFDDTQPIRAVLKYPSGETVPRGDIDPVSGGSSLYVVSGENLFQNTDFSQGNPNNVLVPNDALDSVGLKDWVAQQTGLNPFVSVQRFLNEDGLYTLRMINGIPSFSSNALTTGSKTFFVSPGLNFAPGIDVTAARADSPINFKMSGVVTAYNTATGELTINVSQQSAVLGGGTFANWSIGRNGVTLRSTPVYNTVSGNVAQGATTIPLASTATIERGANVEEAVGNGIDKATYVVDKTSNSITISRPTVGPIASGYELTTYGDQGWYLYQNIASENANNFKNGTPGARTSYLTFKVKSFAIEGTASIMALGYSSLFTLGRSYAAPFPVTTEETVVTVPIYGDTVATPNTWQNGYDATAYPYLGLGFAWVSRGTNTSKNIPPYQWSGDFAVAGAQGQTLDLASVVGAWVEVSEVQLTFGQSREYIAPTGIDVPVQSRLIRAPFYPRLEFRGTRHATGLQGAQLYLHPDGSVRIQGLDDLGAVGVDFAIFNRDLSVNLPGYSDGHMIIINDRVFTRPNDLTPYTPGVVASNPGATPPVITSASGFYWRSGPLMWVSVEVVMSAVNTGSGVLVVDLPLASSRPGHLQGFDRGFTGNPVFGYIPTGSATVQVKLVNGAFPVQNNSIINLSGFYEIA